MQRVSRRHALGAMAVAVALPRAATAQPSTPTTEIEANKEIARRWFAQVVNQGAIAAIDEIVADDYEPTNPGDVAGRDALKQRVADTVGERSILGRDAQFVVDDLIAERDMVAVRWHTEGGYTDLMGLSIVQINDGRIVRIWQPTDSMISLLRLS